MRGEETPKGGPMNSIPTIRATRLSRALTSFMFPIPPYFCHASNMLARVYGRKKADA